MSIELPVLDRPLDNTALSAYMVCPREYFFAMHLHRRGRPGSTNPPGIAYGGLMHTILEWHYRTGGNADVVRLMAEAKWEKDGHDVPGDYRTLERGLLDYRRYIEHWGPPDEEQGQTVGWPDEPLIELSVNIKGGALLHPYAGKIDRIISLGGLHYIEDHKYTSRLEGSYVRSLQTSQQMKGYVRLAQYLMPGLRIAGVRINIIHALKNGTNFERPIITYTQEELEEWEQNTNEWTRRLLRDIAEWPTEDELAQGAPYPVGHYGDATSGKGCMRKFGLCSYHDVCSVGPTFRLHRLQEQFTVEPWDPLKVEEED